MRISLTGVSGVGKSSVVRELVCKYGFKFLTTTTTRPIRKKEIPDIDFYFVTKPTFEQMIEQSLLAEYIFQLDHYYGLSKQELDSNSHLNCVLNLEPYQGIKEKIPNTVWVLLHHDDKEEIKRRILARDSNLSEQAVKTRLDYIESYNPDINLYDLLINVTGKSVQEVTAELMLRLSEIDKIE